jgi:uncharacterized protein YggE
MGVHAPGEERGYFGMKRNVWMHLSVLLVCLAFVLPAFAAEEKKKDEVKIKGAIVEATPDAEGKLASVAIKTDKEQFQLVNNALAKKMKKFMGAKANVTGKFRDVGGKKVFEAWIFERIDESGKKPGLKQPTG